MPNQSQDQATFDARWAQVLTDLTVWGAQVNAETAAMNALAVGLNTIAAGGAYALPYVVDGATEAADPGSGKLRLNNTTQNLATALYLDAVAGVLGDVSVLLASLGQSTNPTKGRLRLVKMGDVTKFMTFNVTAVANSTGYFTLTLNSGAGSSSSPFIAGDAVMMFFDRTGDVGPQGPVYQHAVLHARDEKPQGTPGGQNAATSQWIARTLNAVKVNTIAGASLSSDAVTLPAGTYKYAGSAPAHQVGVHKARLQNVTDNTTIDYGTNESCAATSTRSLLRGQFTIGSTKQIAVQHITGSDNGVYSLGYNTGMAGAIEVYTEIMFEKVA